MNNTRAPKPIKTTDVGAVSEFIRSVEGRASARTLYGVDVTRAVKVAEERLAVLPKRMWTGTRVTLTHAGPYGRAYKYAAEGTWVELVRRRSDWVLVAAGRTDTYPGTPEQLSVSLPADVDRADVIARILAASRLGIPEAVTAA